MTTSEPLKFEIQRQDLFYKASFADSQFAIAGGARSLHFIYVRLKKYGVRTSDIKIEGNLNNPPDIVISCGLPTAQAVLRMRLDSFEINCVAPSDGALMQEVVEAAIAATKDIAGAAFSGIATHESTWAAHGHMAVPVADYLRRFVTQLPHGASSSGLGFALGPDSSQSRLNTYAVVAPSMAVPDGLYLQVNSLHDGRLPIPELRGNFRALIQIWAERLALAVGEYSTKNA